MMKNMPLDRLVRLVVAVYALIEKKMTADPSGCRYGWDWPTANVLWPVLCAKFRQARQELKDRATAAGFDTMVDYLTANGIKLN